VSSIPTLDAVADPVRLSLLRRMGEQGPATLAELADAAQVHPNTVRPHLAQLEASGVVMRETASPHGRGRPPGRFRLAPGWRLPTTDFRGLAELLAAVALRAELTQPELGALGRQWGRYLAGRPGARDLEHEIPVALEQLGFQARVLGPRVVLSGCPCPLIAPDRPELVCRLVEAVVEGLTEAAGTGQHVTGRRHHPERRVCELKLTERPSR
jgi:predicted ArsR family transcriptional regulator